MVEFSKKKLYIKCVFWLSLHVLFETFLILRRNEWDVVINAYWSSCKVTVIQIGFDWNLNIFCRSSKNTRISNFLKIRSVGAELFYRDRRTDMKKLIVAFEILWMHPNLYFQTTGCISVLCTVLRKIAGFSLRRPVWLILKMVMKRVYSAVRIGPLN